MSAPLPVDLAALALPCPACGVPLVLDDKRTTCCPQCACTVGTPGRFVDDKQRRKPLRPAFSTGPLRGCCRCKQTVQRVLVDDVGGSFCGSCNLVFLSKNAAPRLRAIDASRIRVETGKPKPRDGLRPRTWLAVAVALCAVGAVAVVKMGAL